MKRLVLLAMAASVVVSGCAVFGGVQGSESGGGTATESSAQPRQPGGAGADDAAPGPATQTHTQPPSGDGLMPPVQVTELQSPGVAPLDAPADIWERVRRGFSMPDIDNELVHKYEDWYASRPDYIDRMTGRSRMYIFHVVEELELRAMPTELALLPYIESAFNPQAVSSAKAAGIWQFMPGTGRDFQLTQNILRDDRRSVLDSTRAALDYLQKLHDMFGDWHLALAAYNWGPGNVKRAIDRNRAAGLGNGYLDIDMPAETRNYVPKLQAVKNIIADPQAFATALPLIENHPFFDTVEITHDIDVEVAARLAGVRLEDFRALNPSQRKPVIFAAGTPQVLLPWDNADTFKRNLAKAAPGSLASWTAWVAPAAMPPREVARRFGMDEAKLREINDIPHAALTIKPGSTVLVRRGDGAAAAVDGSVVNNARINYTLQVVLRRTTVHARKGDSVATIAARYDLPAATVAGWNKTQPRAAFKPGQAVVLYLPVRAAASGKHGTAHARKDHHRASRHAASGKTGKVRASQHAAPAKPHAAKPKAKKSARRRARRK